MRRIALRTSATTIAALLAVAACQPDRPEQADAPAAAPQTTDDVVPATVPPAPGDTAGGAPPSGLGGARPPGG
jgi:hypothetical protein